MRNSELYELIFRFLIHDEESDIQNKIKNKVIFNENILFQFIRISSNHLVLPAIYIRLKNAGLTEFLPIDFNEHLNDIYTLNVKRNIEILQQVDEINNQLSTHNIEPVYLKGTANLLDDLYTDTGDRMIGDIDFLVQQKEFLKTADIILQLGYKTDKKIYDDIKSLKDYPRLYRKDVPADIEIHRIPVNSEYSKFFNSKTLFKEKIPITNKVNCFVPSDKHKIIHNFIHSQLSNKGYKFKIIPLRDLYDSYLLSKRVNITEVLDEVENKCKAKIYFDFIPSSLNTGTTFQQLDKKSRNFFQKHTWYINHPRTHHYLIKFIKFNDLIATRFLKAFFSKSVFNNLYARFSDIEWWKKRFLTGLKKYFS